MRKLSLLALGLFIAKAPHLEATHTHMSRGWWNLLGLLAIFLAWLRFPGELRRKRLYRSLRYAGLLLMALLFVMFRRLTLQGQTACLDSSHWEILGLLGWAYLLVSALYLLIGKRFRILVLVFAAMLALNTLSTMGWLHSLGQLCQARR
jgi:energy-coupling factor transporter transmembrane protein EcfT